MRRCIRARSAPYVSRARRFGCSPGSILTAIEARAAAAALLAWFELRGRDVPWRDGRDPYRVWIAEIMAQQTRIATMRPYLERFMARWPDVESLADASRDDVMKEWEGLGYYSRARNLHLAAREVVDRYGGRIPDRTSDLRSLPGIGSYTAGAIASIAYGHPEPAVDGNARRVLSRLFDESSPTPSRLDHLARSLIECAPHRAGLLNQAMMDLGSEVCTAGRPACDACPWADMCRARAAGTTADRPPRAKRPARRHEDVIVAVIARDAHVLLRRRPDDGLLGGLWEFPSFGLGRRRPTPDTAATEIAQAFGLADANPIPLVVVDHDFSHLRMTLHAFRVAAGSAVSDAVRREDRRWVRLESIGQFALSAAHRRIADALADRAPGPG